MTKWGFKVHFRSLDIAAEEDSALGEPFELTPVVVPVRAHLDSVRRLIKGDIYNGRGSTLRSRYCNNFKVAQYNQEAATAGFWEMLLQDRILYSSLWMLSGTRLVPLSIGLRSRRLSRSAVLAFVARCERSRRATMARLQMKESLISSLDIEVMDHLCKWESATRKGSDSHLPHRDVGLRVRGPTLVRTIGSVPPKPIVASLNITVRKNSWSHW